MENLRKAPRKPVVHTTITRQNRHNLEEFLDEMSMLPIKGVGFSFYTPHRADNDESGLFIPLAERGILRMEQYR